MLAITKLARAGVLLIFLGVFSPVPVSAAVLFDNSKADKDWDISVYTGGHYVYFFKGYQALGNPPILGPENVWVTAATTSLARVKKVGTTTCDGLQYGVTSGLSVSGPTYIGYPANFSPYAPIVEDYCDFRFIGEGILPGTPLSFVTLGVSSGAVAGSDSNPGTSVDGTNSNPVPGGFAFQLCDAGGCSGGFSTTTATTTPPTPTGPSSVLFLPGIESSRLYEGAGKLWEPLGGVTPVENLTLNSEGMEVGHDIYTKDVMDEAYGKINIYKSFLANMKGLADAGTIADFEAIPYDWRLSLQDNIAYGNKIGDEVHYAADGSRATSTPYLLQEFNRLVATSTTHKVTVVAHSNGGLLLKELLIEHPELNDHIDKIIFVDVPQVGTPQALAALLHGDKQGIPYDSIPLALSSEKARSIANNFPMTYNLLPSESYFTYVDDPVITFNSQSLPDYVAKYGDTIHSTDRMNTFVTDPYQKVSPDSAETIFPTTANSVLLGQAQQLHNGVLGKTGLDDWQPAPNTQLIQIAGWGIPTTVKGIDYKKETHCPVLSGNNCVTTTTFGYEASTTIDGDGTVVTPSQLWTSATLPNVKNYFVDLDTYNKKERPLANLVGSGNKHKDVLEVPDVLAFLTDTMVGSQATYTYIGQSTPLSKATSRLRYSLHSPLNLNLYDSLGRHTGISTTTGETEEQIPGTYYMEFGDAKYLFTDASSTAHVQMSGYATSTFTLNVDQLQGDTLLASTTFKDIPVTPTTQVNLDVVSDISTLSPMHIDLGDGVVHAVTPKPEGTATLDLTPPEITLTFSTTTNVFIPTATDDSGTPILTSVTSYPVLKKNQTGIATTTLTATDPSGNITVLIYTFKYPTKERRIAFTPLSVSYNGKMTKLLNTTAKYKWNLSSNSSYKMFASYIQTVSTSTESHFRPKKNVTIVMAKPIDLDDGDEDDDVDTRATRLKLPGLVIPSLSTKQGRILVSY